MHVPVVAPTGDQCDYHVPHQIKGYLELENQTLFNALKSLCSQTYARHKYVIETQLQTSILLTRMVYRSVAPNR